MMRATHFGAGNIGRGFIGLLLAQSGYEVTFADVNLSLIELLNRDRAYTVHSIGKNEETMHVGGVQAVHVDSEACATSVSESTIVTTSVGVNYLPGVVDAIANGLVQRFETNSPRPILIMACENAIRASSMLRELVEERLAKYAPPVADVLAGVYFADVAVDRIVPNQTSTGSLAVAVEDFFEWDIELPQSDVDWHLIGATFVPDLTPYLQRKLFLLNGTHALIAYVGHVEGELTIQAALSRASTMHIARQAQREMLTGMLSQSASLSQEELLAYSNRVLSRFENPALIDDVARVGRNPLHKLAAGDRLITPLRLSRESGSRCTHLIIGIASGFWFQHAQDAESVELQARIVKAGIHQSVSEITEADAATVDDIVLAYEALRVAAVKSSLV